VAQQSRSASRRLTSVIALPSPLSGVLATFGTFSANGAVASVGTGTPYVQLMRKWLLPQHFPGPRQFRQAAITDQAADGVTESLPCGLPPKLEIVKGGA
jgi:hypothetical protein